MTLPMDESSSMTATSAEAPVAETNTDKKQNNFFKNAFAFVPLGRNRHNGSIRTEIEDALSIDDETNAHFSPEERLMLRNILRLREIRIEDVMLPRADIDAVDESIPLSDLLRRFRKSGHSRMPVYRETLDDPVGMVHIKDVMSYFVKKGKAAIPSEVIMEMKARQDEKSENEDESASKLEKAALVFSDIDLSRSLSELGLVRPLLFVPPSMPAVDLLNTMQASRVQMALVIDEYGGTDGLVSLEDLVEIVVGDIEDEHDDEDAPDVASLGANQWVAEARASLDDIAQAIGSDFNIGDSGEEVDTIGGLLFSIAGRVPVRGEVIALDTGFEVEVLDADPRRIKRVRILRRIHDDSARRPAKKPSRDA